MRIACFATVAVLALAAGAARADEMVPNPEFANWSKFKKGTSVTMKTTTTGSGVTSELRSTSTLIEVGAEKVVVEYTSVTMVNGMELKLPATTREIPKTIAKAKDARKDEKDDPNTPKEVASEEGTETLKVLGQEFKTKWRSNKVKVAGTTSDSKVWLCDDVPGMMVKMESTVTGAVASTLKMELIEFKKP
jgi:hypothetical protein